MHEIIRLKDGKIIGRVSEEYPYPVTWAKQATSKDRKFFGKLLTQTYRTLGAGDEPDICSTVLVEREPEEPDFFKLVTGDLPMKGYQALPEGYLQTKHRRQT